MSDRGGRGNAAPVDIRDVRFQRDVARLHRLGARIIYELLVELGARHTMRTEIEDLAARYTTRLDAEMVRVAGGDRFAPVPLRVVRTRPS